MWLAGSTPHPLVHMSKRVPGRDTEPQVVPGGQACCHQHYFKKKYIYQQLFLPEDDKNTIVKIKFLKQCRFFLQNHFLLI